MPQEQQHLTIRLSGEVHLVQFADRKILDELAISEMGEELTKLVNANEHIKLLLSFKNVEHLSSAALGILITLNRLVGEKSGQLRLAEISPQIFEVFKITRLNKLFNIHSTTQEALSSFD
ncbi:MAG: STAS domain-containing protein [Planctomycetes bacterium]|nr:STAS domain-containing protein [Planctomycetota bacterium]